MYAYNTCKYSKTPWTKSYRIIQFDIYTHNQNSLNSYIFIIYK